jgi:hypothetical protein
MNKKTKCVNNESLKLIIQLEQTKLELAQTTLQTKNASIVEKKLDLLVKDKEKDIEEIKLKQLKVSNKSQSTGGNVNINNFTFNVNVHNIDKMPKCNMTIEEANKLYSDDITQLIQNVLRFHYSSTSDNKCIKHLDKNKFLVKMNNTTKQVKYGDIRETILKNYTSLADKAACDYYPSDYNKRHWVQSLSEDVSNKYRDSIKFTKNPRNNGIVNKSLQKATK